MTTNNTPPGQTMTDAGGDDHDTVATQTLTQYGTARLWALCDGAGASTLSATVCEVFARMLQPWGVQPVGHAPRYRSNIADDEAPFELSVAFSSGAPEIQFYVEPQGETPTLESNMRAGLALVGKLEADFHVCVERLRAVADLFFPAAPQDPFTIWLAASCSAERKLQFKAYLNPQVCGTQGAPHLLDEAMVRLGVGAAWRSVRPAVVAAPGQEVSILSVDLADGDNARVKLYIRHHHGGLDGIHRLASTAQDYAADDVTAFYEILGDGTGPFRKKPPITELSFNRASPQAPASVTLELPIGHYVANDEIARLRIGACLRHFGLPSARYDALIDRFATRPPRESRGVQAHVTLRRVAQQARIAIYFASDAYREGPNETQ